MTVSKSFLVCSFLLLSLSAVCQINDSTVFLKWKLQPGEVLTYKTIMKEVDTANRKDPDMSRMMKAIGMNGFIKSTGSDTSGFAEMNKMMKQVNKQFENYSLLTKLTKRRKNIVDMEMLAVDNSKDTAQIKLEGKGAEDSLRNIARMLRKMAMGSVSLRGAVYDDGRVESFYIPNGQRNLVSLFFELPARSVKPGDTWSLDTHLISLDQNFRCDTSYVKNNVTLTAVESIGGEHVADLEYNVIEYAGGEFKSPFGGEAMKTMMKMTYRAKAKFSIERGRWVSYDGLMSLLSSGLMSQQSSKRYSLIPQ